MTRVVEGCSSDDEFPDLADLAKCVKGKKAVVSIRDQRTPTMGANENDAEGRFLKKGGEKSKMKKRVLNQGSDNPLLRPFASQLKQKREPSGERGKVPDGKEMVTKTWTAKETSFEKRSRPVSKVSIEERVASKEDLSFMAVGRKPRKKVPLRKPAPIVPSSDTDDDEEEEEEENLPVLDDSEGLSDFVVNDSSIVCEEDSEVSPPPAPRSTRKLVRGRKQSPPSDLDSDSDLENRLKKLTVKDEEPDWSKSRNQDADLKKPVADTIESNIMPSKTRIDSGKQGERKQISQNATRESSIDLEDPFTLRFSPPRNSPRKVSKETRFTTPPGSPELKPKGLVSPTKKHVFIPKTPHRQSMDSFWQVDVINDWNDEYSPRKVSRPNLKSQLGDVDSSTDNGLLISPKKSPVKQDKAAREAKKAFSQSKHALAQDFLNELDSTITNGEISRLAIATGGIKIIWSKKLNTTAGRANWKRETIKSHIHLDNGSLGPPTYRHHASIELAEKVIDDSDRLLNVIAHEFCHLANFMISNIKTNPHGKEFKAWAAKCSHHFGERGIEVTTKHSYEIDYKYVWTCEACGLDFKRHSKSIDPKRHQCGSCKSKLVQTKPAPRTVVGEKKVSEYQLFVKENMRKVREENPGSPQKEIMGLVGKRYQEHKASKLMESVNVREVNPVSKEGTPDDVEFVARKLNFFDLTSS